jgi:hypothetical protein
VAGATGLEPATSGVTGHIQTARGKGRGGECATATINHEVKLLSATYHLMQKEGVRVPAVIEFPQVKVPGKLRWFTEDEVAKLPPNWTRTRCSSVPRVACAASS